MDRPSSHQRSFASVAVDRRVVHTTALVMPDLLYAISPKHGGPSFSLIPWISRAAFLEQRIVQSVLVRNGDAGAACSQDRHIKMQP